MPSNLRPLWMQSLQRLLHQRLWAGGYISWVCSRWEYQRYALQLAGNCAIISWPVVASASGKGSEDANVGVQVKLLTTFGSLLPMQSGIIRTSICVTSPLCCAGDSWWSHGHSSACCQLRALLPYVP